MAYVLNLYSLKFLSVLKAYLFVICELRLVLVFLLVTPILELFFRSGSVYVHHPEENSAPSRKSNVSFRQQGSTNDKVCLKVIY